MMVPFVRLDGAAVVRSLWMRTTATAASAGSALGLSGHARLVDLLLAERLVHRVVSVAVSAPRRTAPRGPAPRDGLLRHDRPLAVQVTSCSSSVMSPAGHRIAAVDVGDRLPLEAHLFAADRHGLGDVLGWRCTYAVGLILGSYPWRRGSKQSAAGTLSRLRECS